MIAYLDSSALVKLVLAEPESGALRAALADWPERASSALAKVEVARATRAVRGDLERAAQVLARVSLIPVDGGLLDGAAEVEPEALRSLDAIHLASALSLDERLGVLVTYDRRMLAAAAAAGAPALAPR